MEVVGNARQLALDCARELGREDVGGDAAMVIGELVTNALLHGGGCRAFDVLAAGDGLRIEVRDYSKIPPVVGRPSADSLTGRGILVVVTLAEHWGAEIEPDGKVVWAEVSGMPGAASDDLDAEALLAMWGEDWHIEGDEPRFHVELGDVPTDLLLAAKSHVDSVVREFTLASAGAHAGTTPEVPHHLASLLQTVVDRFAEARLAIKHQALDAAHRQVATTKLSLNLPVSAADAAEEYLAALAEVDTYCRARRLLTLETPPQHRVFRQWYISQLVTQLRAAAAGAPPPPQETFETRLLGELDRIDSAHRASDRAARLLSLSAALAAAATPEAVADAVLNEGVAALGAAAGGILLATQEGRLTLPGAIGYDDAVVAQLRAESPDAELPAAVALRTGEPVWLESRTDRDDRFPALAGMEATTMSLCAVPLVLQQRRLGALRFSFTEGRLFDEDERRFVVALAALTSQALERAQLQHERLEASRRLQRTLLPPSLPDIPGVEAAAMYHPFGDGMEVGGDFYDLWPIGPSCWGLAIGDASGTGPHAAGLTAMVRYTLRALTVMESEPEEILRRLNKSLVLAAGEDEERFCTVVFAVVLSSQDGVTVRLASGGHPPAFVRRGDGAVEAHLVGGMLLGQFDDPAVDVREISLGAGDTLVLLTDGVIEARRGEGPLFETEGVTRVLAASEPSAQAVVAALENAIVSHTGGSLADDAAAFALHVRRTP